MYLKRRICSMVLAIIMILAILGPGISSVQDAFGEPSYVYGNTASNISNYGLLSEYEGQIYFANSSDSNRLYTMKEDGTAYEKVCDDEVQYINVLEDMIYYVNLSDNNTLYAITIDGSNRTQLSTDQCAYVTVVNDMIYYISITDGWKIKACSLTGENSQLLNSEVTGYNLNIVEEYGYYISLSDNLIYRMKLATGETTAISSDTAYQIVVYGDYVFYIHLSNGKVYRINALGTASRKNYTTYTCSHLAVYNDIIYFSMNEKQGIIGSLEIGDFYSDTDVSGIFGACLNTTSSYLYFAHIYENNGTFIYYGDMYRMTYDGKMTQSMADVTAAGSVITQISALPAVTEIQKTDAEAVVSAKQAYDALTDGQKALVDTVYVEKLAALEAALEVEGPSQLISNTYIVDRSTGYVTGVGVQTSVANFAAAFSGDNGLGTVKVYDISGVEVTSGSVGNGFEVKLVYNGATVESFQIVLLGDINGDGRISAMDLLQVQKHLLKMIQLEGVQFTAADINRDARVSAMDLLQVQKHLLKMIVIA